MSFVEGLTPASRVCGKHEVDQLLMQAGQYAEAAVRQAQGFARQVVDEANIEAARIRAEAERAAQGIAAEARQKLSFAPGDLHDIHNAIDECTRVNAALMAALGHLRNTLSPIVATSGPSPDSSVTNSPDSTVSNTAVLGVQKLARHRTVETSDAFVDTPSHHP
jgi:hypothetical protein